MATIRKAHKRAVSVGGAGTPAALFGSKLQQRVEARQIAPASRVRDGNVYYADGKRQGTVRAMQPGRCANFNGTDEVVVGAPVASLPTTAVSVMAWVRADSVSGNQGIVIARNASNIGFALRLNGTSLQAFVGTGAASANLLAGTVATGTWYHVAATYDGANAKLYLNGVEIDTDAFTGTIDYGTVTNLSIGGWDDGSTNLLDGQVFDARVLNRGCTASEVARAAAMKPGAADIGPTDAVLWYPLDEGPEVGTAFNIGSLGSAGDGTVTSSALTAFRNAALNDQYSRHNEVGYSDSPCVDNGSSWDGSIVGTTALDGEFELNFWQHELSGSNEMFFGVCTAANIAAYDDSTAYGLITAGSGGWGFDINGSSTAIDIHSGGTGSPAYQETGVSNRVYKLTVKRDSGNTIRFLIDDVEVHTDASVTDTLYFAQASTAATTRPFPYWQLSKDGVAIDPWTEVEARGDAAIGHGMPVPIRPSDGKDIYGYTPTYAGQCPRDMTLSGPCGTFDGTGDKVMVSNPLDAHTGSFTYEALFKTSPSLTSYPMVFAGEGAAVELRLLDGDRPQFVTHSGLSWSALQSASKGYGAWVHAVCVYDATALVARMYIDGVLVDEEAVTGSEDAGTHSSTLYAGARNASFYHNNSIAYQRVYTRALTAAEAASSYAGDQPSTTSLVLDWQYAGQSGTVIHDVSGNQNHGTLTTSSEATFWGTKQSVADTLVKDGYRRVGSVNIPAAQDGSGLAADGNALTHGPGVLAPGCSLDLSGGEANSPHASRLADDLADLTYEFGDGDEADIVFVRGDSNHEEIAVIHPAATGADLTLLNNWSS